MSDFDLASAVIAARRQADEATASADEATTRLRIRETLANNSARRTRRTTIIAGLLATMFGSTAFAYYSDWRPRILVSAPAEAPPAPTPPAAEGEPDEVPRQVARAIVRESSPQVPEVAMTIEQPHAPPAAVEMQVTAAVPEIPAAPDPELAAYRIAHDVHFKGGSPADALVAWDNYLAQYPRGTLAIDAKYSRALVLIKLERWADARAALQPFADAAPGSYRQTEATKLLAALPK